VIVVNFLHCRALQARYPIWWLIKYAAKTSAAAPQIKAPLATPRIPLSGCDVTPNFPATQTPARLGSRVGVDALLAKACCEHSAELIGNLLTPLFPLACPWKTTAELPAKLTQQHAPALKGIAAAVWAYRQTLTQSADGLRGWLDATDDDVRDYALRCAKVRFPGNQKLAWAVRVTGAAIPGKTPETRWARINDARFWRRAIRVRLLREREHFYLRLKLIGRGVGDFRFRATVADAHAAIASTS
jgi:hypothetical protein